MLQKGCYPQVFSMLVTILRQGWCLHFNINRNVAEEAGYRIARCATGKSTRINASLLNRLLNGEVVIGANLTTIGCDINIAITNLVF